MPSLKMMLKIFSTIAIVAGLGLVVVSGPAPQITWNPASTGEFDPDASANWDLKEQLAPVHYDVNETGEPSEEEIDLKDAENLARTVARPYPADLKTNPIQAPAQGGDKGADVDLFFEGFEAGVPPAGWTTVVNNPQTWATGDYAPFEGTYYATCEYDASYTGPQDEWLITPSYDLSDGTNWFLSWAWNGSYYWSVDPNPNCTLTVYISPDGGSSWLYLWSHNDVGVFDNWVWYEQQIDLVDYLSFTDVKFALVYTGYDGAQFSVDAFSVNDAAPPLGRCCYGADFLTCDDLSQVDCADLGGHWSLGLNCTDNPCPTVPPNDDPDGAITITPGETVTGSTAAATLDCPGVLDWNAVWYRFDAPYAENDVTIDYCGTVGDIYTVGIVVFEEILPLDCNAYIIASNYAFVDCGDSYTNPQMDWQRLPGPATYLFPVHVDDGLKSGMDFEFTFDLIESPPLPPGGSCGDPYTLTLGSGDLPYVAGPFTTCGYGNAYENSCMGYYDGGEDFIMELTLTEDLLLTVSMTSDATYSGIMIADACGDVDPCIATSGSSATNESLFALDLLAGTYYIMVDTWPSPDCIPNFVLEFEEHVATGGDDCTAPVSVKLPDDMTSGPDSDQYIDDNYTCGRGNTYSNTCLGSYDGGEDIIYELDVAGDITVDIELTTTSTWTGLMIADACGDVDPCIDFATGSAGNKALYGVELTTGFYYIMIDTWPSPACIPEFTLTISEASGPQPGDSWELCEPIGDVVDLAFTTVGATPDGPQGCLYSANIWYCYTATCDGLATFSLCGSSYDTKIAVYDGDDPFVATMLGCNDDFCGLQSELTVPVVSGNTYLVEVGGYSSSVGAGILNASCVECPAPANDICSDVTPVPMTGGVPLSFSGDNTCATADMVGLAADGYTWHAFTTTATMDISVYYCGLAPAWENGFIVMFSSCDYADIFYATDWDFTSCGDGNVTINWYSMPAGTWYYPVMKDPAYGAVGPYTIEILGNALSTLTVDPTSVDFGIQPQGATGTEVVDMTASGGTSDITYSISYTYGSKSLSALNNVSLGVVDPGKPDVYHNYQNPGGQKQGGDDIGSAVVVSSIPHNSTGTTAGYTDDYDEACPYTGSTSPDVVYEYTPGADVTVTVSLCNAGTNYDTKLYVYENSYTPGSPFACNDDECPGYISELAGLALTGGNTYYIVIDGYGGDAGDYEMTIEEEVPPPPFECPPGADLEAEACGDDTNGGCNMTVPAFEAVSCGQTICGTAWAAGGTRDTDWYEVTLYETTTITLTGQANFPGYILGFVDTSDCGLAGALDPYVIATNAGDMVSVSREAGPGTYWIFPGMTVYDGYPCGSGANDYWFEIDCPEGPVLWLSADPATGVVPANSTVPLNVNYDATELEQGVYNASVDISHDGGKSTTQIPCTIEIGLPNPILAIDPPSLDFGTVVEGTTGDDIVTLSNAGNGTINFSLAIDYGLKDISGTTLGAISTFTPGATQNITLEMDMFSPDWEWVVYTAVTFPTGITPNSHTDFVGSGTMYYNTVAGQTVDWGDPGLGYGMGYLDVGFAYADVNITSDAGLATDQTVDFFISGDIYGAPPHDMTGTFLLPLYIDPLLSWLSIDVTAGTMGEPVDVTVSFNSTDLPGGVYTANVMCQDDIGEKNYTPIPVTLAVFEWDHVALDPDPVLAIEQNATGPRSGFAYVGELNALDGSHTILDVTGATVEGLAGTIGIGSHPLVQGDALEVEFDLKAFAASYGWPTGIETNSYDIELTFSDMSTYTVTDEFDFAGHIAGDFNLDGAVDIADLVATVNYMFNGGPAPEIMAVMDTNGDCTPGDIADLVYTVNFMFNGGPEMQYCPN